MSRKDPFAGVRLRSGWFYRLCQIVLKPLFRLMWHVKVTGQKNIPDHGGAIIALNHLSNIDPPLVGVFVNRAVHAMAKEELFKIPFLGALIRELNAFPLKRGQFDIRAMRFAQRLLTEGELIGMFPEGTRSKDGNFGRARPGVGMLACLSQVPVVPVRIRNSDRKDKWQPVTITIGGPIKPPAHYTKDDYQRFSERILDEIKKL